jgi:FkbM family methyltransferase
MSVIRRLSLAMRRPDLIIPYLIDTARIGKLKLRSCGEYEVSLDGYSLLVDLDDPGIGKELALSGNREEVSSKAYREALTQFQSKADAPIRVAEIGANIGFYALMPPAVLDEVKVYAAEVDSDNVERLQRNIELNGWSDSFEVDCVAISDSNGEKVVHVHDSSNLHSLQPAVVSLRNDSVTESRQTPTRTAETWLGAYDLAPQDIDVIRMDVEGHEASVLRGFSGVFEDRPVLVHIEIHPELMSEEDNEYIRQTFQDCRIVETGINNQQVSIDSIDDVFSYEFVELVAVFE